jgi:hypothetical protein
MFLGSSARPVREADNLTASVGRLPRQCGILNISQPYRPPRPVTGLDLLYFLHFYVISKVNQFCTFTGPSHFQVTEFE